MTAVSARMRVMPASDSVHIVYARQGARITRCATYGPTTGCSITSTPTSARHLVTLGRNSSLRAAGCPGTDRTPKAPRSSSLDELATARRAGGSAGSGSHSRGSPAMPTSTSCIGAGRIGCQWMARQDRGLHWRSSGIAWICRGALTQTLASKRATRMAKLPRFLAFRPAQELDQHVAEHALLRRGEETKQVDEFAFPRRRVQQDRQFAALHGS
ncbi:MAG: hypothetical protein KatS3mg123_1629 [Burkholderiales bacterium]|nr:MAG: hypothetical protein KatS3mg123_1629 [Burkholderiales bacterium]